mgnify:CR=1 FL=1
MKDYTLMVAIKGREQDYRSGALEPDYVELSFENDDAAMENLHDWVDNYAKEYGGDPNEEYTGSCFCGDELIGFAESSKQKKYTWSVLDGSGPNEEFATKEEALIDAIKDHIWFEKEYPNESLPEDEQDEAYHFISDGEDNVAVISRGGTITDYETGMRSDVSDWLSDESNEENIENQAEKETKTEEITENKPMKKKEKYRGR